MTDTRTPPGAAANHAAANLERAQPDWPVAVIAGAFQTAVLAVRGLQRRGVRAICFDSRPTQPGFRSVYGPARLCPDPDTQSEEWLEFMKGLARELPGKPVLIASSDQFVSSIAVHAAALADFYVISPAAPLQGLLANKGSQYELASRAGMPMPRTSQVSSAADLEAFIAEARFPCLIKPGHFREWFAFPRGHALHHEKVAVAADAASLRAIYASAAPVTPNVIAQEVIEGPDTAKRVYLSVYDRRGRRIAHSMFRELRCDPLGFGPASVTEPVVDEETDAICDSFLRSIGYSGICEIELKRDVRDGVPRLIEANPRLSGGGDASPYVGVDLCWLHYLDAIGHAVQPVAPRPVQVRHVVLRADGRAVPAYTKAGLISWGDVWRSYTGRLAFYDLDPRDWRYSLETLYVAGRSFISGMLSSGS